MQTAAVAEFTGTVTLRVYNRADFTGSDLDIWNWPSDRVFDGNITGSAHVFDSLPVGNYTFCAINGIYGPVCVKPVVVTKNTMAAVTLVLQQAGNGGSVTIDSPFVRGIALSDGAPSYGEPVTITASVTGDAPITYAWSLACANSTSSSFSPSNAATTTLTTDCKGNASITLTVSNGNIHTSVTFPITYYPQGANVSVALNNWPVIGGFSVSQAQLQPGQTTNISLAATDDEPLTYTWSATCGTVLPTSRSGGTVFTAPATLGDCTVTVLVEDGIGGKSTASVVLHVQPSFVLAPGVDFSYCDGGPNANNYGPGSPFSVASWSGGVLSLTKADNCAGVGAEILVNPMPEITSLSFDVAACIGTAPRINVFYGHDYYFCGCGADSATPKTLTFGDPRTTCDRAGTNNGDATNVPTGVSVVLDNRGTSAVSNIKVNGISVP